MSAVSLMAIAYVLGRGLPPSALRISYPLRPLVALHFALWVHNADVTAGGAARPTTASAGNRSSSLHIPSLSASTCRPRTAQPAVESSTRQGMPRSVTGIRELTSNPV